MMCVITLPYYVLSLCGSNSEGTIYVLLKFPVKLSYNNERTCYMLKYSPVMTGSHHSVCISVLYLKFV